MAVLITPPNKVDFNKEHIYIFLAGTIEMGNSRDWQSIFFDKIHAVEPSDKIVVLNPRRPDWDSSWEQSITCKPFKEQVEWELKGLESADIIALNFEPNTQSPISLLEMGRFGGNNLAVHCPKGFGRKGNVDIFCERYGIKQTESLDELISLVINGIDILKNIKVIKNSIASKLDTNL
jgi:hypothetical protein